MATVRVTSPSTVLLILTIIISGIHSRVLYIDSTIEENKANCTQKHPCKTLAHGVNHSAPGDTLILASSEEGTTTYPVTTVLIRWSLTFLAGNSNKPPKIACQVVSPNPCQLESRTNDTNSNSTTVIFNNLIIDGCKLCFTNASAVINETKLVDSSLTMHSGLYTEMLIYDSVLKQTSMGLASYCNKSHIVLYNQTCPQTSLDFFMKNTSFIGGQSGLSLNNISVVDFVMHNVTLKNFKSEMFISASRELKFAAMNLTLSHFLSIGAGIAIDSTHSNVTVSVLGSEFIHNECTLGAAFSIRSAANVTLDLDVIDTKFINNTGSSAGSAMNLDLGEHRKEDDYLEVQPMKQHVLIEDSVFLHNVNDESAAAIYIAGGNVTIRKSYFQNNTVTAELSIPSKSAERKGAGGAIYGMSPANILLDQSLLVNNSANWFGGGIAGGAAFVLTNSNFENSIAAVRSNLGEILYLSGPVKLANLSFNIIHAQNNVPLIWYASNDDYVLQGIDNGFLDFQCPQGSQFRNDSLPELDIVDAYKDLFYFCDPCTDNTYSLDHGYRTGPLSDGVGNWSANFTCKPCSYGAVCKHGHIQAQHNFWGFTKDNDHVEMVICPDGYCCTKDTCKTYNECAENRTGTLCGECKEGMSETLFTTSCVPNEGCKDIWYFAIDIGSSILSLLFFLYQMEIAGIICKYLFWIEITDDDDPTFAGYVKSVFYFYQTIDLLKVQQNQAEQIVGVAIQPIISYLLSFRSIAIIIGACPFPGLNPVTKTILSSAPTLYSFGLLGILTLIYVIYKRRKGEEASSYVELQRQASSGPVLKTSFGSRLALACVSYFLYNYMSISNMTFSLLACVPIADKSVLYIDGNVECIQPWQGLFILIAIIHVFPFFMAVIMSRALLEKHLIGTTQLFISYFLPLPMVAYWLFMYVTKWRHITGVKVEDAMDGSTQLEPKPTISPEEMIKAQILGVIEEPFINNSNAESHRYWEGILIFRRLVLSMIAAFAVEPLLGISLQTLTCFAFLLWHIHIQPFGGRQANIFETVSLSILTSVGIVHIIQATLLSAGVPAIGPNKTQIFVTDWIEWLLVNLFPILLGIALVIFLVVRLFMCLGKACKLTYHKFRRPIRPPEHPIVF